MKVIRLVATEEGESRFTEFDIPILGTTIRGSNGFVSSNVSLVEFPEGAESGWHRASARRIVIIISGVMEVETGDGEKRQWRAGEVFLADDVEGRHVTREIEGPVRVVFVPFPSDFVIESDFVVEKWSA